ncbi:fibronectin type III domain-containing protein [Clostridium cellulovorans]|uniref:Fibronectin type III domain protein n=1 Tax=Clostridium cellulovorans (strain ATCC 35296 / DSM 3052 / OCM 3 / 743B) TaxID=573061 RepID=D9STD9_CLOC7|nr:hypothetical protein [Clostridium cellulovorans]ADL50755.1 Fibronectin type III domain protein [Clostridium cellulovorans 743B]
MNKKRKRVKVGIVLLLVIIAFLYYITWGIRPKVKIEVLDAKNIRISCNVHKNAEFYRIYRSDEKDGQYERIGTVRENKFIDEELKPSTTYWYKVAVIKDGKEGKLTFPSSGTTKELPPTPVNVSADSITFESATIRWNKAENVRNYYIYRADDENNYYNIIGQSINNSFIDRTLSPSKKYKYKITSNNENGESETSSEIKIETAKKAS